MTNIEQEIDEILASAKAKIVETMNSTNVAPNAKEIELTHTGEYKDGDIVNVRINNFAGHPVYSGTVKGYEVFINRKIPYKIDVGTQISLLSWPEAKSKLLALIVESRGLTVTRLEVIDHTPNGDGREFVKYYEVPTKIEFGVQDEGRTLKIFVSEQATLNKQGE